jgi:hypothetical protein
MSFWEITKCKNEDITPECRNMLNTYSNGDYLQRMNTNIWYKKQQNNTYKVLTPDEVKNIPNNILFESPKGIKYKIIEQQQQIHQQQIQPQILQQQQQQPSYRPNYAQTPQRYPLPGLATGGQLRKLKQTRKTRKTRKSRKLTKLRKTRTRKMSKK